MELIDKTAIVTEIERRIKALHSTLNERETAVKFELKDFLSFLNSLEVKEVDVEKEIKDYLRKQPIVARSYKTDFRLVPSPEKIAKHFFELGMAVSNKAKKEEMPRELADEIDAISKRYPEVSFAKLSRIAARIAKWQQEQDEPTSFDRGMAEEIIIHLKRIEEDYKLSLTEEIQWLRNITKKGE